MESSRSVGAFVRARPYEVLAAVALVALGIESLLRRPEDWHDTYLPAGRLLLEGKPIYGTPINFTYPPAAALFAAAFGRIPAVAEPLAWYLLNASALVVFWVCSWRASGGPRLRDTPGAPAVAAREHAVFWIGMAIAFRFVPGVLEHQQTDILIASVTAAAALAAVRNRWIAAAAACSIGAAIKATPIGWAGYLLLRKKLIAAALLVALALGLNLLADLVSAAPDGGTWLGAWARAFVAPFGARRLPLGIWLTDPIQNQSMAGTLFRLLAGSAATNRMILLANGTVLLLGVVAIMRPGRERSLRGAVPREALESSIVLLSMVLLSPISSKPHFVVLLLPAYCVARLATHERDRAAGYLVSLALVLSVLSHQTIAGRTLGRAVQWAGGITACALALWLACVVALVRGAAVARGARIIAQRSAGSLRHRQRVGSR